MARGDGMFGAPVGIEAALDTQRDNTLGAMKALKDLGEIEGLPQKRALEAAHARYYNAAAGEKEEEARADRLLAGAAGTPGVAGSPDESLSDPLARLAKIALSAGFIKKGADLQTKASQIRLREQQIGTSAAREELALLTGQREELAQIASVAASVTDQSSWDRVRMTLAGEGAAPGSMPERYEDAKPLLDQMVTQGMRASETLLARERAVTAAARNKTLAAQAKAAGASADAARARLRLTNQTYNLRRANGGDTSTSMKELREARTAALKDATRARDVRDAAVAARQASIDRDRFPPPSAAQISNPSLLTRGQPYSTPKGVLVFKGMVNGKPTWGTMVEPKSPAAARAAPPSGSSEDALINSLINDAPEDFTEDGNDD